MVGDAGWQPVEHEIDSAMADGQLSSGEGELIAGCRLIEIDLKTANTRRREGRLGIRPPKTTEKPAAVLCLCAVKHDLSGVCFHPRKDELASESSDGVQPSCS